MHRPGQPLRTVLLDVDGTLLDTREFVFRGFEHSLASFGLRVPPRAELARHIGPPLEHIYASLVDAAHAVELSRRHRDFQVENLELVEAFAGAHGALDELRARGLRLAAVTSRSKRTSTHSLAHCDLLERIECVISAEDAVALKPDPRHLQAALCALGVDATGVAMVGDTAADIIGGRNLGALTVAARYGFHGDGVLRADPDRSITDIRELPAALLNS